VNSGEENRENFCKTLDRKPLFSALYGTYMVTMNELKAVHNVSAQGGQSGAVNKTSVESMAQDDDFHEVKRRKRHASNDTSQTAMKSNKPVPTSAAVRLPPKAVLTRNFSAPLRTADMNMETSGIETRCQSRRLPENQVGRHHSKVT
jgi:hypothetical protein